MYIKIISIRTGRECNHSTRDYGYMSGIEVYYDYGTFDMRFEIPYNTELFKMLQKFKKVRAVKRFNVIDITIYLYCEEYNENPDKYVDLALDIRDAILEKDEEVIKLLHLYHGGDSKYNRFKPETELGKRLKRNLTICF